MPINPSIALQAQAPKVPNLLDSFSRAQSLRNQQQQGQINAQEMEVNDLKLQGVREQKQEQDRIKRAFIDSEGEPEKFIELSKLYGAGPETIFGLQDRLRQQKEEAAKMSEEERKRTLEKYDQIRAMLIPIMEEKDDAKAGEMFQQARNVARIQGLSDEKFDQMAEALMPGGQFNRDGLRVMMNGLTTGTKIMSEADKAMRAQAAMIKAQSYSQNLQARIAQTDFKNETDRLKLEIDLKEYERLLAKDANVDEIARMRLTQDFELAREKIRVEREKEAGRNNRLAIQEEGRDRRLEAQEEGKDRRLQFTQAEISRRAKASGKSEASVAKSLRDAEEAAKRLPGWEDMDTDQQIETIETLSDSFLTQQPVDLETGEGEPRMFGLRSGKPVTTVTPRAGAASANKPAAGAQNPAAEGKKPAPGSSTLNSILSLFSDEDKNKMVPGRKYKAKSSTGKEITFTKNQDGSFSEVK